MYKKGGIFLLLSGFFLSEAGLRAQRKKTLLSDTVPVVHISSEYQPVSFLTTDVALQPQHYQPERKDTMAFHYRVQPAAVFTPYKPIRINPLAYEVIDKGQPYDNYFSVFSGRTYWTLPTVRLGLGWGDGGERNLRVYASHTMRRNPGYHLQQNQDIVAGVSGNMQLNRWHIKSGLQIHMQKYMKYGTGLIKDEIVVPTALQNDLTLYYPYVGLTWRAKPVFVSFHQDLRYVQLAGAYTEWQSFSTLSFKRNLSGEVSKKWLWQLDLGFSGNYLATPVPLEKKRQRLVFLYPQVAYKSKNWGGRLGFNISSVLGERRYYLPYIDVYYKVDTSLFIHLGWEDKVQFNNILSYYELNPWVSAQDISYNTQRIGKWFVGVRNKVRQIFDYSLQLSFNRVDYLPLFVNKTNEPQSFSVLFHKGAIGFLGFYADAAYWPTYRLKLKATLDTRHYLWAANAAGTLGFWNQNLAYGLPTLRFNFEAAVSELWKYLSFYSGVDFISGKPYKVHIAADKTKSGMVFSEDNKTTELTLNLYFLARFKCTHFLSVYARLDNILNRKNPLWFAYDALPLGAGAGVIVYFKTQPVRTKKISGQ